MPVTFTVDPSKKAEESLSSKSEEGSYPSVKEYIEKSCRDQAQKCQEIFQASFGEAVRGNREGRRIEDMIPMRRGSLVDVATRAYNKHHHFVLRYAGNRDKYCFY